MNDLQTILEQVRAFLAQHAPAQLLNQTVPLAIACVVAGVGLSLFGAKLARFGMTGAFAVLGGVIGHYFAEWTNFPSPVCILAGALMVGLVAYHTFRLWVGLAAAVVLSTITLGLLGYQRVVPHLADFRAQTELVGTQGPGDFVLRSPEEQQAFNERTPADWFRELWTFVTTERDVNLARNSKALIVAAMVTGLCLGVLAMRWALILSTSLVGTLFVTSGLVKLLVHAAPGSYETLQSRPDVVGMAVGAFLVTSLILQTLLTRRAGCCKAEAAAKS